MFRSKKDRVLIYTFKLFREIDYRYREDIAHSMGISASTFEKMISSLIKQGLLTRRKDLGRKYIALTHEGGQALVSVMEDFDHQFFTAERHGINGSIKVIEVLERLKNPYLKIFMFSRYVSNKEFDLLHTLQSIDLLENESSVVNIIENSDMTNDHGTIGDFVRGFMDLTFYGITNVKKIKMNEKISLEGLIIEAEVLFLEGKYELSLDTYNVILKDRKITKDIWLISNIGKIRILASLGRIEEFEFEISEIKKKNINKLCDAYLDQILADTYSSLRRFDDAKKLFTSALNTFEYFQYPIFLSILHNNFGVMYFNMGDVTCALRHWEQSLSFSKNKLLPQYIACIGNLTSAYRKIGEINKAEAFLARYEELVNEAKITRMYQGVSFNRSLLELSKGNIELALKYYDESLIISNPYPNAIIKEEMRLTFLKEAIDYGFDVKSINL